MGKRIGRFCSGLSRLVFSGLLLGMPWASSVGASCDLGQLPPHLKEWVLTEQTRMARVRYNESIKKTVPDPIPLASAYLPENRKIFLVKSYWIPKSKLHVFVGEGFTHVQPNVQQIREGKLFYRLFVHPESEVFYQTLLKGAAEAEPLCATPTSSSRTLVIWKEDQSITPFFGKLSLDRVLSDLRRLIDVNEVTSSIGMNQVLSATLSTHPEGFSYVPEVFGMVPKTHLNGGMLIRTIPEGILNGSKKMIPLYALYGHPLDGFGVEPLLVSMLKKVGERPVEFVRHRLIRPFAQMWIRLALDQGYVPEAHGQNTLLELDESDVINGKFIFRDLDGFALDLKYRKKLNLEIPSNLPFLKSVKTEYAQSSQEGAKWTRHSLYWFNNTLNVLNVSMIEWLKAGWLQGEELKSGDFEEILKNELVQAWKERVSLDATPPKQVLEISDWVMKERANRIKKADTENACLPSLFRLFGVCSN